MSAGPVGCNNAESISYFAMGKYLPDSSHEIVPYDTLFHYTNTPLRRCATDQKEGLFH